MKIKNLTLKPLIGHSGTKEYRVNPLDTANVPDGLGALFIKEGRAHAVTPQPDVDRNETNETGNGKPSRDEQDRTAARKE